MDNIDLEILNCLRKNARMSASAIGKKINLSVSAVSERIRKLEKQQIINSYTITLNHNKMGKSLIALIEVSLEHPKYHDLFAETVLKNPDVQSCYYLTGEFDFFLRILTDSVANLENIHRNIKSMRGVKSTKTHFVLKEVKNDLTNTSN